VDVLQVSSYQETAPVGGPPGQGNYLNAAAELATDLTPDAVLARLLAVEAELGRVRTAPNAPRTLDLDVLLYGDATLDTPALKIPHPRMHERAFVLQPLVEIAPDIAIPRRGSAKICLQACAGQEVQKIHG
jgi:2-amino-4-hydroxy-6-hydroxymethyldihydropteridine diphosphokinase